MRYSQSMGSYDHRRHAGNAGDVWKHFLLCEAAGFLIEESRSSPSRPSRPCLAYMESHAGRPDYHLNAPGEWQGGIGRILPLTLESGLRDFFYFDILADCSSGSSDGSIVYPGSGRLICELAKRKKARFSADLWDDDRDVSASWDSFLRACEPYGSCRTAQISFHQGEGFSGVLSRLNKSPPGLLFIDPPYVDSDDALQAKALLQTAVRRGWTVLWWYMTDVRTLPQQEDRESQDRQSRDRESLAALELVFGEAGLDGGRWSGSTVALAGGQQFHRLLQHLGLQKERLIRMLKSV